MKKNKAFRYGGYATLAAMVAVLLVICINLLVDQIPLRIDMTLNKVFSLSKETETLLESLEVDVSIAHVLKTASEDPQVREVLRRYGAKSDKIIVETIDPELNPNWARKYDLDNAGIREGTIVVSAGKRFKVITRTDMYNLNYSDSGAPPTITSLALEQRLTSAIQYVLAPRNLAVYSLQGHGEDSLATLGVQRKLENVNFDVFTLNLLTLREVPPDVDVLMILNPKSDLTDPDLEKLLAYMERGGRLLVATDPGDFPNLAELLKAYGVAVQPFLVVEGRDAAYTGNPLLLLPALDLHDITKPLRSNDIAVLFPFTQAIGLTDLRKKNLRHERLVASSRESWAKSAFGSLATLERSPSDPEGPFALAMAITDPEGPERPRETRLVVFGSHRFLTQPFFNLTPGNSELMINSTNWLASRDETLVIQPKDLVRFPLIMNNRQKTIYAIFVVIVLPLSAFAIGLLVWLRRRHR